MEEQADSFIPEKALVEGNCKNEDNSYMRLSWTGYSLVISFSKVSEYLLFLILIVMKSVWKNSQSNRYFTNKKIMIPKSLTYFLIGFTLKTENVLEQWSSNMVLYLGFLSQVLSAFTNPIQRHSFLKSLSEFLFRYYVFLFQKFN